MTLDSRLNWEEHIYRIKAKAKRKLNTIKVVTGHTWGGDGKTIKKCTVQYIKGVLADPFLQVEFQCMTEHHK